VFQLEHDHPVTWSVASTGRGNGPLAAAAFEGHLEVVEALLAAGASVEAQNESGRSPGTGEIRLLRG
jgi:hypothetical protein